MQPREAASHRVELRFAERFLDARKHFVFFEPHVIVKEFSEARDFFRLDGNVRRKPLLEIHDGGANLGVIRRMRMTSASRSSRVCRAYAGSSTSSSSRK